MKITLDRQFQSEYALASAYRSYQRPLLDAFLHTLFDSLFDSDGDQIFSGLGVA